MLPMYVILDTRETVLNFLKASARLGLAYFSLRTSGVNIFEALYNRDPEVSRMNKGVFLYEYMSDLLTEEPDNYTEAILEEVEMLFLGLEDEMVRFGFYDRMGFSQYVFHSWTADHCAVMVDVMVADDAEA